jgi:hypothetical protein
MTHLLKIVKGILVTSEAILLDKNIVRYWTIALLKTVNNQSLLPLQQKAMILVTTESNLFISKEVYHILTKRVQLPQIVPLILNQVDILYPTKYHKRWIRRLQEITSFTREDAVQLAYGTFSTNQKGSMLGVTFIYSTDKKLATEYKNQYSKIEDRFHSMIQQFEKPFSKATLPEIRLIT